MHLRREMRVHRMIRQLAPALSGCWPGDTLVVLLLGETNLTRNLKIHGPKISRSRKVLVGLARRTRSRLVHDISVSLGMRRCKNLDS